MRTILPMQSFNADRWSVSELCASRALHRFVFRAAVLASVPFFPCMPAPAAQTQPSSAAGPAKAAPSPAQAKPAHKPAPHRAHKKPAQIQTPTPPPPVVVAAPPPPEPPHWPVNDKAVDAVVTWDSHGLLINASNSSLQQILNTVSMETGAKVEGLARDERVFGSYGPGRARDVLGELLQGSGYNVLMIGDQGEGTPRELLLSVRPAGGAQPAVRRNTPPPEEDTEVEEPAPSQEQPPNRPGFPPGGPRTPQQLEELRQREQQIRDQQGQPNLPGQPPINPQN